MSAALHASFTSDVDLTSLGYGLLLGSVGASLTSLGISIFASIAGTARSSRLLLGDGGVSVQARLLRKTTTTSAADAKSADMQLPQLQAQGIGYQKQFFLVSYVFDGVRATDGTTMRIEVRDRKVPSFVWKQIDESEAVTVRYMKDEPRRCRIAAALDHERRGFLAFKTRSLSAMVLCILGAVCALAAAVDNHAAGAIVWGAYVVLSMAWQCQGRACLLVLLPCLGGCLRPSWSPLWMHRGMVIYQELGKGVVPSESPDSIIPAGAEVIVNV